MDEIDETELIGALRTGSAVEGANRRCAAHRVGRVAPALLS